MVHSGNQDVVGNPLIRIWRRDSVNGALTNSTGDVQGYLGLQLEPRHLSSQKRRTFSKQAKAGLISLLKNTIYCKIRRELQGGTV